MSKVISFRFNPENPREAEALIGLQNWLTKGFSIRHTIAEALLKLESSNSQMAKNPALIDLSHHIKELLDNIDMGSSLVMPNSYIRSKEKLSDGFVSTILKTAKPEIRAEA